MAYKDKEKAKAYLKEWHAKNKEKTRAWEQENREKRNTQRNERYAKDPEKHAAQRRECRANNLEKARAYDRQYYAENRERQLARDKAYYEKNRETILAHQKQFHAENKERVNARHRSYHEWNRPKLLTAMKTRTAKRRFLVIKHYSKGKFECACCGDTRYDFFEVDHINNDGNEHRKTVKGSALHPWLIKNDYPEGFQILCTGCNKSKSRHGGVCRHDLPTPRDEDFE